MRSARLLVIGSYLLFAYVAIADDKPKVIVTDAHSWESAPDLGGGFDEVARFNWVKTQGRPRAYEIHSTLREQCREVLEVGSLEMADYVLVFDNHNSNEVAGYAATTRNMIGRESGSSLTESIRKACDGISGHWALNRDLMHTGISAEKTTQKGGEISAILTGSVTGVVVDENGRPMSDATAYLESPLPKSATRPLHTGSDGRFFESNLAYGTYFLFAERQTAGYTADHYNSSILQLGSENPHAAVTVALGAKAGILLLSAIDAVSGQPVEQAFVQVSSECPPETIKTAAGKKFLIPSGREYKLEVRAPGYESWHYTTDTGYLRLEPEQEMKRKIPLKRIPQ
jgi:hypothetical protein